MAAAGGDTVVPTNWGGLIVITVIVAVVAAATYFGMEFQFGHQGNEGKAQEDSLSVQDVFSASARREVAAAGSARVLSRADLASTASHDDGSMGNKDMDGMGTDSQNAEQMDATAAADDDWGSSASDDWDTAQDDWDSLASDNGDAMSSSSDTPSADDWDAELDNKMQAAADVVDDKVEQAVTATKQAGQAAMDAASDAADAVTDKVAAAQDQVKQQASSAYNAATSASAVRQRPDAEALRDWWSDANGGLAIRFAGTLDRGDKVSDGIAVMFSEAVSPAQGNQHMQLKDASGAVVSGQWKTARNPNMLIMDGLKPGRYDLAIDSAISSQNGQSLSSSAHGPVFVY